MPRHNFLRHYLPILCPFWQVRLILYEMSGNLDSANPEQIPMTYWVLFTSTFTNSLNAQALEMRIPNRFLVVGRFSLFPAFHSQW